MNKNEFLDKLASELAARKVQNIAEILLDFDQHFKEAMEAGQGEEAICKMLGDPVEIAEQYTELNTFVELREEAADNAQGVHTSLTSANLILQPHGGSQVNVQIKRNGLFVDLSQVRDEFDVEIGKDFVRVTQHRQRNVASWLLGMFELKTVIISVPQGFSGEMQLSLLSGNLEISGVKRASTVLADVLSGNIKISGLSCDDMTAKARSGNVRLEDCSGAVKASCFSGNVSVLLHKGYVKAESKSGNVSVETDSISSDTEFSTKSGNVKVSMNRLDANMTLKCVSGNVSFTVYELHGNITGSSVSGTVKGHLRHDTKAIFNLNSTGTKNDFSAPPEPFVGGLPYVNLSTRSGFVRVKKI